MMQETKKRQRSCIGCGTQAGKASLHRVVRASDGTVSYDPTGRAAGRGAYVCSSDCFARAWKGRKLDRALRCKLNEDDYTRIADELARGCGVDIDKTEE
ncbi:RNase P modulator RnpM [Adlercreutzia sp. ZJ473]|uniref:RNase P modulator RnpM n=1 Tax=Adlercreutzia sp. ZJ473 TaxID=2722822 RepID=UPI00155794A7|nr:YlxR family protein [Adlercreutzia sp. ZJ473]